MRAVALIDGEHYPPVVRDALAALPYEWVGAILVGGTEKLRGDLGDGVAAYGVPLVDGFAGAEVVVDLSDEPVLGPVERFRWASRALAAGLSYVGADFRFDPPLYEPFPLPAVAIIGTGKRVGKTAVSSHVARLFARDRAVVAVAMGRGGPAEPEVIERPPTVAELVELSRAGRHAASDHLELAALTGVTTIGCRRAGGGLAGAVFTSNVSEGARIAASLAPDVGRVRRQRRCDPARRDDCPDPGRRRGSRRRRLPQPLPAPRLRSRRVGRLRCRRRDPGGVAPGGDGAARRAGRGVHGGRRRRLAPRGRRRARLAASREPRPARTKSLRSWTPTRT